MIKPLPIILLFIAMVAFIVGIDILFFKAATYFWPRLIVNIGIVLIFMALYLRFFA